MPDRYGVILKVNRAPFQPKGFASAQSIERSKKNRNLKICAFCGNKEAFHLFTVIEAADKAALFGTLNFIRRIRRDQINLHGVFQSLMDIGMIVNDRTSRDTLQLIHVKFLNVGCPQISEGDLFGLEIGNDYPRDHIAIGRICCNRYCRLNDLQPLQHEIREQDGLFQRLFFWNIFLAQIHEHLFCLFLVALYRQTS